MYLAVPDLSFSASLSHDLLVAATASVVTAAAFYFLGVLNWLGKPFAARPPAFAAHVMREGEQQVRIGFSAARIGKWKWEQISGEIVADEQMRDLCGLPQNGEPVHRDQFFKCIHPEDVAEVRTAIEATFHHGPEYSAEFRAVHPDGSTRWLSARGALHSSERNEPAFMVGIIMDIHSRKTAELALADSELKFHTLADCMPQLAWMADPVGDRFWYNRRWFEYTGTTPEQMAGTGWQSQFPTTELAAVLKQWQTCNSTRQPFSLECRIRNHDGTYGWFLERATPITDSSGKVTHWLGTDTDITEIRETREALKQSEDQFRQIADSMPQLVWVTKPDGQSTWWNKQWKSYTGRTLEELGSEGWPAIFHPDDVPLVWGKWRRSLGSGQPLEVESRIRSHDGNFNWFLIRGVPLRHSDGSLVKWFATFTCIEDYKQAESQTRALNSNLEQRVSKRTAELAAANKDLAHAKAQLQAILNSVTRFSIIVTNPQGLITMFNRGAERMLQYDASEMVGVCTMQKLHCEVEMFEQAETLSRELGRPIEGFDVFAQPAEAGLLDEREWTYIRKDGTTLEVLLAVSAIYHVGGSITGYFGIASDITDQKSLERELRENNANLIRQTERAKEANLAKSTFLATMSHEIRTPMNAILGMSDLLWESDLDEDQRQYVEVFRRAGNVLLDLINSVLDLSKIEAGHLELESQRFDLEEVIVRTIELLNPKAQAKGIRLFYGISPDVQTQLIGDAVRLQQILVNLVGNAVKFTDIGEVVCRVCQDPGNSPGCLQISVSDTGIGIPSEQLHSVFEDFSQGDSSTTRRYGGTGLGLGISQRLITSMGGQLRVRSKVGAGSVFQFTLELKPAIESRDVPRDDVKDLHGLSIMVIDNNETNCLILRETLTSWGLLTTACSNAEEGSREILRARLDSNPYSMVILDCQMPDVDGFAAVPFLRESDPGIPIVMLTSDNRPGDGAKRAHSGLSGYALRPVRRAELLRLICRALESRGVSDAPSPNTEGAAASTPAPVKALNILIAEDSPDNRLLIQVYLKSTPHVLTLAENGAQALEQFMVGEFDLILMDVQMPIMDGLAATRTIRAYERAQRRHPTPIIALTANALAHDAEASYQAGCDEHLSKPISKQRLLAALDKHSQALPQAPPVSPIFIAAPDGLEDLAPKYLESRQAELPVLQNLLFASDFDGIRKKAHDLKGTGSAFGFGEISRLGAALENSAKLQDESEVSQQLHKLSEYLQRVQVSATPAS